MAEDNSDQNPVDDTGADDEDAIIVDDDSTDDFDSDDEDAIVLDEEEDSNAEAEDEEDEDVSKSKTDGDDDENPDEESEDDADDSDETSDEESTEDSKDEVDAKEKARLAYQQRQIEKKALQDAKAQVQAEELQRQQEAFIADADSAEDEAARSREVAAYNGNIRGNVADLKLAYSKAINDIELFKNPTPEVQEFLANAVDTFDQSNVKFDKAGNPVEVNGDLYQYLVNQATSVEKLIQSGARKESTAKAKTKAATTPKPGGSKKTSKPTRKDNFQDGFDSEFSDL